MYFYFSRDKAEIDKVICENWMAVLIERAGLFDFGEIEEESMIHYPDDNINVEAVKCLCNLAYNSEKARELCARLGVAKGLMARLKFFKDSSYKVDLMLYDLKLLFILTILRSDVKNMVKDELHGMDYLTSILQELIEQSPGLGATANIDKNQYFINVRNIFIYY